MWVDDTLRTDLASELPLGNTTVMVLDQSQGRDVLVILGETPAALAGAVGRLISGEFRSDLVSDFIALRRFGEMGQ